MNDVYRAFELKQSLFSWGPTPEFASK